MFDQSDIKYMQRCLQLAAMAKGNTYPNPMVGSVVVYNGKIIGEGYHQRAGEPHAEVNAIHSVRDKTLLPYSTIYVNLEPCAHYGKTPPCSLLIKEMKIPRVVIGCVDSFSEVSGRGIKMLEDAGVEVVIGVLEKESRELNCRFFTFHEKKRPYIILKWAQTLDGFVDIDRTEEHYGEPTWITNEWAKRIVHKWRTEEQSILVGTNTAEKDNPSLNVREWSGKSPLRVVLDRSLRLQTHLNLFDGTVSTVVFTEQIKVRAIENVQYVQVNFGDNLWNDIFTWLHVNSVQSIIIEGGSEVLNSLIDLNLWDEARVFVGNKHFGKGVKAPIWDQLPVFEDRFQDSELFVYKNHELL